MVMQNQTLCKRLPYSETMHTENSQSQVKLTYYTEHVFSSNNYFVYRTSTCCALYVIFMFVAVHKGWRDRGVGGQGGGVTQPPTTPNMRLRCIDGIFSSAACAFPGCKIYLVTPCTAERRLNQDPHSLEIPVVTRHPAKLYAYLRSYLCTGESNPSKSDQPSEAVLDPQRSDRREGARCWRPLIWQYLSL